MTKEEVQPGNAVTTVLDHGPEPLSAQETLETVQRLQTGFVIAHKFPRHEVIALSRIRTACKDKDLAEKALYRFPRGKDDSGKTVYVNGPSIRLAECIAQSWGNLDYGVRELEHHEEDGGRSVIEAYCVDLETNTHQRRVFTVHHKRKARGKVRFLDDPRDVYEHVANYGARRMRACILGIVPKRIVDQAIEAVRKTLSGGTPKGKDSIVDQLTFAFAELSVTPEMIGKYLGHPIAAVTDEELVDLRAIYTSIKDGQNTVGDYFGTKTEGGAAGKLNRRVQEGAEE